MDNNNELATAFTELKQELRQLRQELHRTQACIAEFSTKYSGYLSQALQKEEDWREIKRDAKSGAIKATAWSVVCGAFGVAAWAAQRYIVELLKRS